MGAVCYKPKRSNVSKDDVLRALTDRHVRETITEPSEQREQVTEPIGLSVKKLSVLGYTSKAFTSRLKSE